MRIKPEKIKIMSKTESLGTPIGYTNAKKQPDLCCIKAKS